MQWRTIQIDKSFPTRTQLSLSEYRSSRRRHSFGGMPVMRMRSQRDIRSMLSKAALKSTNAMYNVRLCSLHFSIICRRAKIWSMVERPGMKPACCIRLRDLIAETDLRRRISARSFPGIVRRVIPRWFAQVRRSPLRFQNGRMMPLRQSSGIFSLIQTQFIINCSHCSMHSPPNFKNSAVILHIPAALSFFSDFTAFRTSSSVTAPSDMDKSVGAFAAALDVSGLCGTGSLFNSSL